MESVADGILRFTSSNVGNRVHHPVFEVLSYRQPSGGFSSQSQSRTPDRHMEVGNMEVKLQTCGDWISKYRGVSHVRDRRDFGRRRSATSTKISTYV